MEKLYVVTKEFMDQYQKSVEAGEDDYSLVDYSCVKPLKENFNSFDDYWKELTHYLKEKYKYTYGSKAQKK